MGPSATPEEVHQAYRNLSRLLHPDQQSDESLRRLAETQMKRLNGIHEILSDRVKRLRYDLSLSEEEAARRQIVLFENTTPDGGAPGYPARRWKILSVWASAAILAAVALVWHVRDVPGGTAMSASAPAAGFSVDSPSPGMKRPERTAADGGAFRAVQRQLEAALRERDAAYEEISQLRAPPPPAHSPAETQMLAPPEFPAAAPVKSLDASPEPVRRAFAGTWLYARQKADAPIAGLYPPLFIEAVIVEAGGAMHGRYRARYQVADRTISPDVAFRFQAQAGWDTASFSWSGAGGAKGEGSLRLVGAESMEVAWVARELGTQMGLASGTALLTRRREP